jgi:hypothetical protein
MVFNNCDEHSFTMLGLIALSALAMSRHKRTASDAKYVVDYFGLGVPGQIVTDHLSPDYRLVQQ